jgi:D-alanine-D-alanine ligase
MGPYSFGDSVILFGGVSAERLVSVASAQHLTSHLPEATLLYMDQHEALYSVSHQELIQHQDCFTRPFTPSGKPLVTSIYQSAGQLKGKVVIIAFHGHEGTKGKIQKYFEKHHIAFTGSGSKASALAFDKVATKALARKSGILVAEDVVLRRFNAKEVRRLEHFLEQHGKLVLKPVANGSSVGLFIISSLFELHANLPAMQNLRCPYLAEPFVTGREVTIGVWNRRAWRAEAISSSEICLSPGQKFDYASKYLGQGVEEFTPARLNPEEIRACQQVAVQMHELVGCRGYSRSDMILTEQGPVLLEINTLPGLSSISFIPQQLSHIGVSLREFFQQQIMQLQQKERPAISGPFHKDISLKLADKLKGVLTTHVRLSKH